jgi:hypothetical protein
MNMDYVITFVYGDERNKVRINNAASEKDAVRSAIVRARIRGLPHLENSAIEVRAAAYQKKKIN